MWTLWLGLTMANAIEPGCDRHLITRHDSGAWCVDGYLLDDRAMRLRLEGHHAAGVHMQRSRGLIRAVVPLAVGGAGLGVASMFTFITQVVSNDRTLAPEILAIGAATLSVASISTGIAAGVESERAIRRYNAPWVTPTADGVAIGWSGRF